MPIVICSRCRASVDESTFDSGMHKCRGTAKQRKEEAAQIAAIEAELAARKAAETPAQKEFHHLLRLRDALSSLVKAAAQIEHAYATADADDVCLDDLPCVNLTGCLPCSADEMHFPVREAIARIDAQLKTTEVALHAAQGRLQNARDDKSNLDTRIRLHGRNTLADLPAVEGWSWEHPGFWSFTSKEHTYALGDVNGPISVDIYDVTGATIYATKNLGTLLDAHKFMQEVARG